MDHLWTPWRMPYLKGENHEEDDLKEGCIFCYKVTGDDENEHILKRGKACYVTLNLYPYNNGHLLIVPNRHIATYAELTDDEALEIAQLTRQALAVLDAAYAPQAYNIGINLGAAAGAGIEGHLHQHIVPRWAGDTNFMTVAAATRVIPEWIDETYRHLKRLWPAAE